MPVVMFLVFAAVACAFWWWRTHATCPACRKRSVQSSTEVLVAPTRIDFGRIRITERCRRCPHTNTYETHAPPITDDDDSTSSSWSASDSSSSSSSSPFDHGSASSSSSPFPSSSSNDSSPGSGFGGGHSSGGGAGSSW